MNPLEFIGSFFAPYLPFITARNADQAILIGNSAIISGMVFLIAVIVVRSRRGA